MGSPFGRPWLRSGGMTGGGSCGKYRKRRWRHGVCSYTLPKAQTGGGVWGDPLTPGRGGAGGGLRGTHLFWVNFWVQIFLALRAENNTKHRLWRGTHSARHPPPPRGSAGTPPESQNVCATSNHEVGCRHAHKQRSFTPKARSQAKIHRNITCNKAPKREIFRPLGIRQQKVGRLETNEAFWARGPRGSTSGRLRRSRTRWTPPGCTP